MRWVEAAGAHDVDALVARIQAEGGMGPAVHTFYCLHDEVNGQEPRERAGFETVRNQNRLMLESTAFFDGGLTVESVQGWTPELERFLSSNPDAERAVRVRDEAWFHWRFLDSPFAPYSLHAARRGDDIVGFVAARTCDLMGEVATWAVEWIATEQAAIASLTGALLERARADSAARVGWILPDTVPAWLELQALGARIESTPWFLDVRTFSRRTTDRWLQQRWDYTLADFTLA